MLPFLPQKGEPPLLHAHKVVLVVPRAAQALRTCGKIERLLRNVAKSERVVLDAERGRPTSEFGNILQTVSTILVGELSRGNRVHLNLSSGSKMVALAAGMAGMAHIRPGQGSIYYVHPSGLALSEAEFEEHGHTKGVQAVEELELMPVLLPEPVQMRVLGFLRQQPEVTAEYRDLLRFLTEIPGSGYATPAKDKLRLARNWNNAITTSMVRKVLNPLHEQGLIEILDKGRQRGVLLTSRGVLYASMTGTDRSRLRTPLAPRTNGA